MAYLATVVLHPPENGFKLGALILSIIITITVNTCNSIPIGYSYSQFIGPVSGPEQKIFIKDEGGGDNRVDVDFVAQPDYHFSYGVQDAKSGVLQNRKETRHGDTVKGEYSLIEPDGTLRVVKYSADNVNGFQAEVINKGASVVHGPSRPPASSIDHDGKQHRELETTSREEDSDEDGSDNSIEAYDDKDDDDEGSNSSRSSESDDEDYDD